MLGGRLQAFGGRLRRGCGRGRTEHLRRPLPPRCHRHAPRGGTHHWRRRGRSDEARPRGMGRRRLRPRLLREDRHRCPVPRPALGRDQRDHAREPARPGEQAAHGERGRRAAGRLSAAGFGCGAPDRPPAGFRTETGPAHGESRDHPTATDSTSCSAPTVRSFTGRRCPGLRMGPVPHSGCRRPRPRSWPAIRTCARTCTVSAASTRPQRRYQRTSAAGQYRRAHEAGFLADGSRADRLSTTEPAGPRLLPLRFPRVGLPRTTPTRTSVSPPSC